jgi:predicted DNA-binding transcriptional regulator AlpA
VDERRALGTTPEVAAHLQVPVKTLYAWKGRQVGPPAVRVGKHLRYRWSDVEAWLDQQTDGPRLGAA